MKKGFTLIELLAVITILSLVALITSISVANMLKESKDDLSDAQMKSIKAAAEAWGADNIVSLPTGGNCAYILLKNLKDDGLLDSNIVNPKNKKEIDDNLKIKITSKINGKGKSALIYEVDSTDVNDCQYIGSSIYVDLPKGFTPVIYDGENWKVANTNQEWYDYDNQEWANAVVLKSGVTKKAGDVVTVEGTDADVLMMYVWIPRYEYKIEETYGKNGESASNPGEIEIKFINNSQTINDDEYRIHPAFTFGDKEVSGFWIGKFELSKNTNSTSQNNLVCNKVSCIQGSLISLRILPNQYSLRYNDVSNFFYAISRIKETKTFGLSNIDMHMIKNSEWGAVAYLSQSKYGKYGNSDYGESNREIYQNKHSQYLTGRSNGGVSTDQCDYDDMTNLGEGKGQCGPGASTTGNIYGVYDMSGGAWEYVMGAYGTLEAPELGSSGFSTSPNPFTSSDISFKYYDVYAPKEGISFSASTACKGGICYGHALSETSAWYGGSHDFVTSSEPWIIRGGDIINSSIFSFLDISGDSASDISTRVVGIID